MLEVAYVEEAYTILPYKTQAEPPEYIHNITWRPDERD